MREFTLEDFKKDNVVEIDGSYWKSIGRVKSKKEVPNIRCVYVIGETVYKRDYDQNKIKKMKVKKKEFESDNMSNPSNDTKLKVDIKNEDKELMVIVKELLKGFTLRDFKKLYGEDNLPEMYNMKKAIENSHDLSWKKFNSIIHALNLEYEVTIRKKNDNSDDL